MTVAADADLLLRKGSTDLSHRKGGKKNEPVYKRIEGNSSTKGGPVLATAQGGALQRKEECPFWEEKKSSLAEGKN